MHYNNCQHETKTSGKTSGLCIDNRSRASGTGSDFIVTFPRFTNVTHIRVIGAEIPNTLFEIETGRNMIDVNIDSILYAITIPNGKYTGITLAAQISSSIDLVSASPGTVSLSFNEKNNIITFIVTTSTLNILAATGVNRSNGLWSTIGFDNVDIVGITSTQQTAQNTVQLRSGDPYVFIKFHTLGGMISSDGEDDIMAKVVSDDVSRFKEVYSVCKQYSNQSPLPTLKQLHISIVRRDGSTYNLYNNSFSLTVSITCQN
jgi:hypothetical protein